MSDNRSRDQVWGVMAEALETFDQKNRDYGDAWRKNGWRGNLPRIFEKADRVKELLWRADPRTPAVNDESAVNTLVDMLNSIAFTIINLREGVEYGNEIPRSRRVWTPGPESAFVSELSEPLIPGVTTTVVPSHLLSGSETFVPAHDTPFPDEDHNVAVRQRPIVDNPQA